MSNPLNSLFAQCGYTKEQMIRGIVADGIASEAEVRAVLDRGNPMEIARFFGPRTQQQQQCAGLMQQAAGLAGVKTF